MEQREAVLAAEEKTRKQAAAEAKQPRRPRPDATAAADKGILVSNPFARRPAAQADRERFVAGSQVVSLAFGEVLCEPGGRIRHVYFPTDSFLSLAAPVDSRASLEVGLIGNEGMLGIPLVLGLPYPPSVPWCGAQGQRCACRQWPFAANWN